MKYGKLSSTVIPTCFLISCTCATTEYGDWNVSLITSNIAGVQENLNSGNISPDHVRTNFNKSSFKIEWSSPRACGTALFNTSLFASDNDAAYAPKESVTLLRSQITFLEHNEPSWWTHRNHQNCLMIRVTIYDQDRIILKSLHVIH